MKKKHILIASILAFTGLGMGLFAVRSAQPMMVRAEEEVEVSEEEIVVSSEEPEVISEEQPTSEEDTTGKVVEETTNKFKQIWESYLLPAILSVNITSLAAGIVSIFLAIRNSKTHKSYELKIASLSALVVSLSKQMLEYVKLLGERNETVAKLLEALKNAQATTETQIALYNEQRENFLQLQEAVVGLVNLEVELAKSNPELVKNGIASQIVELKDQLFALSR